MIKYLVISLLVVAPLSVVAAADPVDNYGVNDIQKARYTLAINQLERAYARRPSDESILLNLAFAYRKAGRAADAATLYRKVLSMQDYELNTVSGTPVWAHDLARQALGEKPVLTARK
jgi:Flp pilus assembly protein TadD